MHGTNDCVRFNREKLISNEYFTKLIMDMLKEIKGDMRQFTFHMRMDSVDVSEYFPLRDAGSLNEFFDRKHEEWPLRRRGFYHLLFTTVTTSKRKFGTGLLHTLFTRDFVSNHRWPVPGYLKKSHFISFIFNFIFFKQKKE